MRLRRIIFKEEWLVDHPYIRRSDWDYFAARLNPMPVGAVFDGHIISLVYVEDLYNAPPGSFLMRNEGRPN